MNPRIDELLGYTRSQHADLYGDTFPLQRAMCLDRSDFVSVCCSRRAGKSEGIARLLLDEADKHPVLYFTTSRKEAKRIMWQRLKDVNEAHDLGCEFQESELIVRVKNRDRIYLTGCDNETEIGKMRGSGWGLVVGDESQLFPGYIEQLVEQTLVPATADFSGRIFLLGTPGPVPNGYFYATTLASSNWSRHSWNATKNPHLKTPWRMLLDATLKRRGLTEQHPSIRREFFGEWAYDSQALVFKWEKALNDYDELPELTDFVFGVDLGWDDADAIAVLGWLSSSPNLYLVEESVLPKQLISELADKLEMLNKKYSPLRICVDAGGLGKKIVEEMRRQKGGLPLEAADKLRKHEHIEMLNDSLRTGRFRARASSRFAADSLRVEWDKSKPEKPKISDRFHSDICDAVLYGFFRSLAWLHEPKEDAPPPVGTSAWALAQEDEMRQFAAAQVAERLRARQEQEEWG